MRWRRMRVWNGGRISRRRTAERHGPGPIEPKRMSHADVQEIEFEIRRAQRLTRSAVRSARRRRVAGHAGREDGPEHGAVAPGHARRAAHRPGTGWRDHHQGDAGRRLSASRRRKDRREHDLHPVHPVHGSAGLSRAAGEQRRLCAGGRKAAGHRQATAAALPVHPRDLLRTGAHLVASARAWARSRWTSAR